MIPVHESNLKKLDNLEKRLTDQMLGLARDKVNFIENTVMRARDLRQFVIGLCMGTIGIVFPLILNVERLTVVNYFVTSLILFSIALLFGLIGLILPTLSEMVDLPKIVEHHINEANKTIQRIREIRTINDNNVAGKEYESLASKYKRLEIKEKGGIIVYFLVKYEDLIVHSLFIVGFSLLVFAIFKNLISQ